MRRARQATADAGCATYLKATEVAKRLNIHRATVYKMGEAGEIKAVRFGNSVRFTQQSVDDYEAAALAAAGL